MLEAFHSKNVDSLWKRQILIQVKTKEKQKSYQSTKSVWVWEPLKRELYLLQIRSDQSLSPVRLFMTQWIAARQASLSITNSQSSLRLTSIESVMPSSHLILCRPLLLLLLIPPSIRVFSSESTLRMRWPKYWSFSFSINPSKETPGLISFRTDCICLGPTKTWKISSLFIAQKPVYCFDGPHRCVSLMESIISPHFYEIFHNRSSPFCLGPVDVLMIHIWKSPHVFVERICDDCWIHWVYGFTLISPLKFLPITFSREVLQRRNLCWWVRGTKVKVAGFFRGEF